MNNAMKHIRNYALDAVSRCSYWLKPLDILPSPFVMNISPGVSWSSPLNSSTNTARTMPWNTVGVMPVNTCTLLSLPPYLREDTSIMVPIARRNLDTLWELLGRACQPRLVIHGTGFPSMFCGTSQDLNENTTNETVAASSNPATITLGTTCLIPVWGGICFLRPGSPGI